VIADGIEIVRNTLSNNFVRAEESEKIKAITRSKGSHRIIDKVKATLDIDVDRLRRECAAAIW
jgi:ATP-dependent Lon protease